MEKKGLDLRTVYLSLLNGMKLSRKIPLGAEFSNLGGVEKQKMEQSEGKILGIMEKMFSKLRKKGGKTKLSDGVKGSKVEQFEKVKDFSLYLFRKVDSLLANEKEYEEEEEMKFGGIRKPQEELNSVFDGKEIFGMNNEVTKLFVPKIEIKLNGFEEKDLKQSISNSKYMFLQHMGQLRGEVDEGKRRRVNEICGKVSKKSFLHPYAPEVSHFYDSEKDYLHKVVFALLDKSEISKFYPSKLLSSRIQWIKSDMELYRLSGILDKVDCFSVCCFDHIIRSFHGFVCLIVISTNDCDYFIDTLVIRRDIKVLNSSFTNPKIVKLVYDPQNMIMSFQRDFGLYFVNLVDLKSGFDVITSSSKMEKNQENTFASFLFKFCNRTALKRGENVIDWRKRPLYQQMIAIAQERCCFLRFCFEKLKQLINTWVGKEKYKDSLIPMIVESKKFSLLRFEKKWNPEEDLRGFVNRYFNSKVHKKLFFVSNAREAVIKNLFGWRDKVARSNDESYFYVLKDSFVIEVLKSLPVTRKEMEKCFPIEYRKCFEKEVGVVGLSQYFLDDLDSLLSMINACQLKFAEDEVEETGRIEAQHYSEDELDEKELGKLMDQEKIESGASFFQTDYVSNTENILSNSEGGTEFAQAFLKNLSSSEMLGDFNYLSFAVGNLEKKNDMVDEGDGEDYQDGGEEEFQDGSFPNNQPEQMKEDEEIDDTVINLNDAKEEEKLESLHERYQ